MRGDQMAAKNTKDMLLCVDHVRVFAKGLRVDGRPLYITPSYLKALNDRVKRIVRAHVGLGKVTLDDSYFLMDMVSAGTRLRRG